MTDVTQGFQDLKSRLEKNKSSNGKDLYTHVSKVMSAIMKHCPHDSMNKLEEYSYLLKLDDAEFMNQFVKTKIYREYAKPSDDATKEVTAACIAQSKPLFVKPEIKLDEEGKEVEPEAAPPIGTMPDILADSKVWEWAGIGFGQYETLLL